MHRPAARKDRVYLATAALVPFALDILFTSIGQPATYWAGDRTTLNEVNPVAAWLLGIHPAIFLAGALLYALLLAAGILFLPKPLAWWLSIALLLAHAGGARSWLWHFTDHYSLWEGALNGAIATLATCCFLKASRRQDDNNSTVGHER